MSCCGQAAWGFLWVIIMGILTNVLDIVTKSPWHIVALTFYALFFYVSGVFIACKHVAWRKKHLD
jgi:membrane protein DedA with SNARE-associated domain